MSDKLALVTSDALKGQSRLRLGWLLPLYPLLVDCFEAVGTVVGAERGCSVLCIWTSAGDCAVVWLVLWVAATGEAAVAACWFDVVLGDPALSAVLALMVSFADRLLMGLSPAGLGTASVFEFGAAPCARLLGPAAAAAGTADLFLSPATVAPTR